MSDNTHAETCDPQTIGELVAAISADPSDGLLRLEAVIRDHPRDARLHFLRGSLLAGAQRYAEARTVMGRAVELAPDYPIARYQLGFLEFTSGDTVAAAVTWAPLQRLGLNAPLALFAQGLQLLTQDRFAEAVAVLEDGIARNTELPPVNNDIQLIIDGVKALMAGAVPADSEPGSEPTSAAHLLLRQYGDKSTKH